MPDNVGKPRFTKSFEEDTFEGVDFEELHDFPGHCLLLPHEDDAHLVTIVARQLRQHAVMAWPTEWEVPLVKRPACSPRCSFKIMLCVKMCFVVLLCTLVLSTCVDLCACGF